MLRQLPTGPGLMLVAFVLGAGVALLALLRAVPVYDNSKRRRTMIRVVSEHDEDVEIAS